MELYIARQPIFDSEVKVVAYELLYRAGNDMSFDGSEGNAATAKVISASFYSPGGREIMRGKPAFINFPRELLVEGGGTILPPEEVVIEILETVDAGPDVIASCHNLHALGYRLALDDFVPDGRDDSLPGLVDYIKVDFRATTPADRRYVVNRYGRRACLLAEKVETQEEFQQARSMGYSLFQGYFFAHPVLVSTPDVPVFKLNRLRILQQLQASGMDFAAMSELVSHEAGLSYKLLRFVNSALFTIRRPIDSIQQAMLHIGELGMRRWLPIVILTDMTADKPGELAVSALHRAYLCELLAPEAGYSTRCGDFFLLGLFSRLDAMYGRPLDEILSGLGLNHDIAAALLGTARPGDRIAALWDTVIAYEHGDWDRMTISAGAAGIHANCVPALSAAAFKWADLVMGDH
jgi:EAL and modified HD-GYP domain-containing signal transduction protein